MLLTRGVSPSFFYALSKIRLNDIQHSLEILVLSDFLFIDIQILNLAIKTSLRSNFGGSQGISVVIVHSKNAKHAINSKKFTQKCFKIVSKMV